MTPTGPDDLGAAPWHSTTSAVLHCYAYRRTLRYPNLAMRKLSLRRSRIGVYPDVGRTTGPACWPGHSTPEGTP